MSWKLAATTASRAQGDPKLKGPDRGCTERSRAVRVAGLDYFLNRDLWDIGDSSDQLVTVQGSSDESHVIAHISDRAFGRLHAQRWTAGRNARVCAADHPCRCEWVE